MEIKTEVNYSFEDQSAEASGSEVFAYTSWANNAAMNPWPTLSEFFEFRGQRPGETDAFLYACVLCRPYEKFLSASKKSRFSLRKHVERRHTLWLPQFLERCERNSRVGRKRQAPQPQVGVVKSLCTSNWIEMPVVPTTSDNASPNLFQERLIRMVVDNMLAFSIVENPKFRGFASMIPGYDWGIMTEEELTKSLETRYMMDKHKLQCILANLTSVSTTADVWTCGTRAYLGMSVHWIDQETLKRKNVVLGCQRLRERPTRSLLAKNIHEMHLSYSIENAVRRITTDNAANFPKTFETFSNSEAKVRVNSEDSVDVQEVAVILEDSDQERPSHDMPKHSRCAAHTLSLVATADAAKALADKKFKKICSSAFAKTWQLWDQRQRILIASINEAAVPPIDHRWNSLYNAVAQLVNIFKHDAAINELNAACKDLQISSFTHGDQEFLKAYVQVMEPIAKSLNVLQGEERAYMGALVPTLALCLASLGKLKKREELSVCYPLIEALTEGLMSRFGHIFVDMDCLLATALNPQFKLSRWPELVPGRDAEELRRTVTNKILSLVNAAWKEDECSSNSAEESPDKGDFLEELFDTEGAKQKTNILVNTFLHKGPEKAINTAAFPSKVLLDLFLEFNTPIPSSVAVEHVFRVGTGVIQPKPLGLSDTHFEMLIFLKGNMDRIGES